MTPVVGMFNGARRGGQHKHPTNKVPPAISSKPIPNKVQQTIPEGHMDDLHRALARALTNVSKLNKNNARLSIKEAKAKEVIVGRLASCLGISYFLPRLNELEFQERLFAEVLRNRADLATARITIKRLSKQLRENNIVHYIEGS